MQLHLINDNEVSYEKTSLSMRILKVISMSYKALVKLCKILSMLKLTGDTLASVLLGKEARSLCIASAEAQSKRIVSCDLNAVDNPGSRVASAPGAAKSKAFPVVGWTSPNMLRVPHLTKFNPFSTV